ncbi:LuxR C-terminal-related transcriptional regulator [Asanoa iriomotensis]|uniref:LuxR family transcriptional regulator n=1 Tax=Asanoa iriomotensis TaxID=234613 RepID=A0ABQ4BZI4_9ACTN|nr:LuxR C-terminal-related transcriptional regulator [Asanoa iriomotensis]GIF55911.1 LuxR family transcriptional regulator [Asanoa iriomotensis]
MPRDVERRELVAVLDRAVRKRVTIISAPAGSGKTSLLRAWVAGPGRAHTVAFLSVEPGQHDAQLFWLALLGAVRTATGGPPPPAPAPQLDGPTLVDRVRSELASPGGPDVLIIDDLHELTSHDATEQLTGLLTELPPGVHAIVATRHDGALRLHRLRLAGELSEIRADRLRFSQDETRQLLAAAGIRLPDPLVTDLYHKTEGWVAGLRLAVLSLAGHPDPERFVADFSGSDRTVVEYLMAELLDRQPPEVRRLLLRTSLLDRVNGELADLLTGGTGAERILLELEDDNAFVVSLDPDRTWFRYHHLFGGLLRLELRRTSPRDIPDLHRTSARWLADHDRTAEAIGHLQAAGDWTDATRLLTEQALSLTLDGRAGTVGALLRAFPTGIADDFPGLSVVHAIADLDQARLDQAGAHLDVARAFAATADQGYGLHVAVASLDLLLARLRGDLDAVLKQAGGVPPPAGRSNIDVALGNDLRALALLNQGVAEAWSGRLADSERHLRQGAALARDIGRTYLEVACLAHLGFATTAHSLDQARRDCEDAIAYAAQHGWEVEPVIAPAQATLAGILVCVGDLDRGGHWLDVALRATQGGGEPGIRVLVHLVAAGLVAARGRHRDALEELLTAAAVRARMAGSHAFEARITGWTIATRARLGQVQQARATLATVDARLASTAELRNAAAVTSLAEHDPAGARREVAAVLDGHATRDTLVETHLLDALACRDLDDERAARASLERALRLAEPDGLVLPFAVTGAWELLTTLPAHETSHAALVASILDSVHGGGPRPAADRPTEDLSPSELRVLRYLPTNLTRPEIAAELSVSLNTVNTHIRRIYAKLGATDRSAAVRRGRDLRLLASG